jgi:hypothetical protein
VGFFCGALQQASWEPQDDEPHVAESQAMAAKLHLCAQNPCSVARRTEEATTNTAALHCLLDLMQNPKPGQFFLFLFL